MTSWLPSLMTDTPEAGYDLAVKLSRYAVKLTQPDAAPAFNSGLSLHGGQ